MLFNNATCCTNSLLSCFHVDTTNFLNIMSTLVVTCMILGRLECTRIVGLFKHPHRAQFEPPWPFPQGSKAVDTMYHLTPTCVDGIKCYRPLAKEPSDMFKFSLSYILMPCVEFNTMAKSSRLCADLLEHNFEYFFTTIDFYCYKTYMDYV